AVYFAARHTDPAVVDLDVIQRTQPGRQPEACEPRGYPSADALAHFRQALAESISMRDDVQYENAGEYIDGAAANRAASHRDTGVNALPDLVDLGQALIPSQQHCARIMGQSQCIRNLPGTMKLDQRRGKRDVLARRHRAGIEETHWIGHCV